MSELTQLLVKGIRQLPEEEQDAVLAELLDDRIDPSPQGAGRLPGLLHHSFADPRTGLISSQLSQVQLSPVRRELGAEGGPWQTVPVRLSTDQHERLKQWCQTNDFTMAVVLRGLVARFLDAQSRRAAGPEPPA
jgi:hypothetical protein